MFRVITIEKIQVTRKVAAWRAKAGYQTRFEARGPTEAVAIDNLNALMDEFDLTTKKLISSRNPYLRTENDLRRIAEYRHQHTYHMKRKCAHGHQLKRWTKTAKCIECYPEKPQ